MVAGSEYGDSWLGQFFFFSIFAAIERFMICSNRLLGDSRLQYQQYYLLARA